MINELMAYNKEFVLNRDYTPFLTSKFPDKKLAIVTCMDTRLTELLPAALGLKNGDAKIIKNAGGVISHPFGSAVRSLLIAIYELGVTDIMLIGHTDCGVQRMDSRKMTEKMLSRGVSEKSLNTVRYFGVDLDKWLSGFDDAAQAVVSSVSLLKNHPLVPKDVKIYGCIMNSETGELTDIDCNQGA